MIPVLDSLTCTGCGACKEVCPPQAIEMKDDKAFIYGDLCEECGFCAAECPVGAFTIIFPAGDQYM